MKVSSRNAGIKLNPKDKVISDSNSVQEGTTLTVVRAFPVSVTVNGKTRTVYTTQTTAEDLAEELGFKAPNYTTAASGAIQASSTVNIVRVTKPCSEYYGSRNPSSSYSSKKMTQWLKVKKKLFKLVNRALNAFRLRHYIIMAPLLERMNCLSL